MKTKYKILISVTIPLIALCGILIYLRVANIQNVSFDSAKNEWNCTYFGKNRKFILYLPETCDSKTSLVVMLHGYGNSARSFQMETEFEKSANVRNYAVLYVNGTPNPKVPTSSSGWQYNNDKYSHRDVDFIIKLSKYCQKKYKLGKNVFAVGFSNGGFMVNTLSILRPDFFTAVVSVAGMMNKNVWQERKVAGSSKIGFLQINGTKDDVVPMELNGSNKNNPNVPVEKVLEYFVQVNDVAPECEKITLSDCATFFNYGNTVGWGLIENGRHNWPDERFCNFDVNNFILDFFDNF